MSEESQSAFSSEEENAILQTRTQAVELVRRTVRVDARGSARRLNLKEIAKLAGVSKSTVSRVLRGEPRVSPITRERVKTIIEELKFRPNVFARGLRGAKTGLIGVLSRWIESGYFAELLRRLDDEVKPRGGRLLCSFTPYLDEYVEQWRLFAQSGQVDGVILIAPEEDLFRQSVQPGDVPCVVCNADPQRGGVSWRNVDSVNWSNVESIQELVGHLYEQGCRRITHFAGDSMGLDGRERANGFLKVVRSYLDVQGSIEGDAWTMEMGYQVMRDYLECKRPLPDAIVAYNDSSALGMIKALHEAGRSVPGDVAITGWDDERTSDFANLTTVDLPVGEMARVAVGMLFERLSEKDEKQPGRHVRIRGKMISRASSRFTPKMV